MIRIGMGIKKKQNRKFRLYYIAKKAIPCCVCGKPTIERARFWGKNPGYPVCSNACRREFNPFSWKVDPTRHFDEIPSVPEMAKEIRIKKVIGRKKRDRNQREEWIVKRKKEIETLIEMLEKKKEDLKELESAKDTGKNTRKDTGKNTRKDTG